MTTKIKRRPPLLPRRKQPLQEGHWRVEGILAAFGAREGTFRAKLLSRLARDIGRPVVVSDLMTAVYGKDDGERGKLGMVMKGAFLMIEKRKPGYRIDKTGARGEIDLHADGRPLINPPSTPGRDPVNLRPRFGGAFLLAVGLAPVEFDRCPGRCPGGKITSKNAATSDGSICFY